MAFVEAALAVGTAILPEAVGSTAATMFGGALLGAGAGGLYGALTGGDMGKSALMGGVLGGAGAGIIGAPTAAGSTIAAPLTGANVAGTAAVNPGISGNAAIADFANAGGASMNSAIDPITNLYETGALTGGAGNTAAALTEAATSGIPSWVKYGGGALALGALMQQQNRKYGTTNAAPYNGNSLSSLHYDSSKYTPLTTPQPNPPYSAQYANYVKSPYNAYAAEGGHVVSMAAGGIADANPIQNPSIGSVEQMSRDNAVGQNQMFPQANINSPAFANATNTPMGTNMIAPAGDTNVDPYSGAERFAVGGLAATKSYADGGSITPDQITANSVNYNNALMQQLQGALNTPTPQMNPGQVAQQAPLQVPTGGAPLAQTPYQAAPVAQSYQGYGAPSFTRIAVPNIALDPQRIPGNPAQQAKAAADAEQQNNFLRPLNYSMNMRAFGPSTEEGSGYAAGGGVGHLGGYAAGGNPQLLKGPGDGMSDNIPASIGGKQPARLADGEFVVPADVVSHLGNGSTDAGAKHLYNMMDKVRKARTGNKKQGKQIKPEKFLKG